VLCKSNDKREIVLVFSSLQSPKVFKIIFGTTSFHQKSKSFDSYVFCFRSIFSTFHFDACRCHESLNNVKFFTSYKSEKYVEKVAKFSSTRSGP